MPDPRRGRVHPGDGRGVAARRADANPAGECAHGRGAGGPACVAGPVAGAGAESEACQPGGGLVRRRSAGRALPGQAGGGAPGQADRAAAVVGCRAGAGERPSDFRRRSPRLWRHAVRRQRAAGHPRTEGAWAGGDAVSLHLHGRAGGQCSARSVWRRAAGAASLARASSGRGRTGGGGADRQPVRPGERVGPEAHGAALCPDRAGGGGGRPADRLGDGGADMDARRSGRLSGG